MYEAAIKRAGLSMNRILFSNTKMLLSGFPTADAKRFDLSFRYKTFEEGKETSAKCKLIIYAVMLGFSSPVFAFCPCLQISLLTISTMCSQPEMSASSEQVARQTNIPQTKPTSQRSCVTDLCASPRGHFHQGTRRWSSCSKTPQ